MFFSSETMETCPICCDAFTAKLRKPIECKFCKHAACTGCVKNYLLSTSCDPKCMKCDVAWDPEFIDEILSKNFRTGELRKHRESVLFEREKSMLPGTVSLVEVEVFKRAKQAEMAALSQRKAELHREIADINEKMFEIRIEISSAKPAAEKKTFIKACPADGCRGFLSTQWKCGVCDTKVCNKCLEVFIDGHECKLENVETAKQLAKDSKNCPKCAALIYKVSGCSQIWCTQCHVAFDWNTGRIETGVVHNPHYYDWLRKQNGGEIPRNAGDVPCGDQMPELWMVTEHLRRRHLQFDFYKFHRAIRHAQHVEVPRLAAVARNADNSDLRVRYLMREIDESAMKRELQKRECKATRAASYLQVYEMLAAVGVDLMNKVRACETQCDADALCGEFEALRAHFNDAMCTLSKRHGSSIVRKLGDRWFFESD